MQDDDTTAIAIRDPLPKPVFSGRDMAETFAAYGELQKELDRAMPDQIMQIQGRAFRKKGYWRSVRTAFNLSCEMVPGTEQRVSADGDWGYSVMYRATFPSGKYADGDGACMASEKWVYDRYTGAKDEDRSRKAATVHNVRSHAHTRAFNRAVSNLVGFGEVSAEEMREEHNGDPRPVRPPEIIRSRPPNPSTEPLRVSRYEDKTKKNGEPYLYVELSDGRKANIWDTKVAELAKLFFEAHQIVAVDVEETTSKDGKTFRKVIGIEAAGEPETIDAEVADDNTPF